MADYKIKSNLDLYGNSINNFAIQADSGFPASPIMGRTQFYTGGGEYATHIVVYDGKSWKAVAYTDDVKNNADFINLKARVDAFLDGGVNSNDVLDNLREIQQFLDTYGDTTKLVDLLGEINEDIAEQADRISDLESKATQVSVQQTITAGKEIGKSTVVVNVSVRDKKGDGIHYVDAHFRGGVKAIFTCFKPIIDSPYFQNEGGMMHTGEGLGAGAGS